MRSDMGKVIIERPRSGSRSAKSAKARMYGRFIHDEDGLDYDGITRMPASKRQSSFFPKLGDKDFTDVLGPLNNYLLTSCGRPWNDVYSEIARTIGRAAGWGVQHILKDHMPVAINTYRGMDGNVYVCNKHGIERVSGGWRRHDEFYVEPETGILREAKREKRRRWRTQEEFDKKPVEVIPIGNSDEYRKLKGIWYYREFVEVLVQTPRRGIRGTIRIDEEMVVFSETKRQLNRKQLRALGLKNGEADGGSKSVNQRGGRGNSRYADPRILEAVEL